MADTMKAGTFGGVGILKITDKPIPTIPGDDWVIIENEGCGVCGSDLHILSDPPGFEATLGATLGHEFLGRVVEVGSKVLETKVGDRVVVAPNLTCGVCKMCKAGLTNHCENWTTLGLDKDGGFQKYTAAPERALHQLSRDIDFNNAVWAEPLSVVVNGTDKLGIQPGQKAVVIGAGAIGILHAMVFKSAGASVVICDITPFRLNVAKEIGIDGVVNVKQQGINEAVADFTDGMGAEVVVDAVGSQFATAIGLTARRGKISLFGMNEHALPPTKQFDITRNELTVYGSFVGMDTFPRAIKILESGVIKPAVLNTMTVPVAEMQKGIDSARAGEAVKVIVVPE